MKDVTKELQALYVMLREALPLARQKLVAGGVDLIDQEAFWNAYGELQEFVDPDEDDVNEIGGLNNRIDDLEEAAETTQQENCRYRWRPISELDEDYRQCVLLNINDPGDMKVGSNLDLDFDPVRYTHFTRITPLSHEEAERMMAAMNGTSV